MTEIDERDLQDGIMMGNKLDFPGANEVNEDIGHDYTNRQESIKTRPYLESVPDTNISGYGGTG